MHAVLPREDTQVSAKTASRPSCVGRAALIEKHLTARGALVRAGVLGGYNLAEYPLAELERQARTLEANTRPAEGAAQVKVLVVKL